MSVHQIIAFMFSVLWLMALNPTMPPIHLFHWSMHPTWAISRSHNSHFNKMSQHSLSIADSGKTIAVKRGDTLTIKLAENPTTGYRWSEPSLDNTGVILQRSQFINSGGNTPGAGGQRVLTVHAEKLGQTTLSLKNWRDWEGDSSVLNRFTLTIQVTD